MHSLEKAFFKYSSVLLFTLILSSILEFNLFRLNLETDFFQKKTTTLQAMEKTLRKECLKLKEEKESLNDPDYVRLLLMKRLGVIGENQTKVTFR